MRKLRKDQRALIDKLAALLSVVTADDVDEVMDIVKNYLTRKTEEAKNRKRLEAFDGQVKTLIDKGYPEAAGMEKNQFVGYVNRLRDEFEIGDIIVIPERIVSISKQMSLVKLAGKTGYTSLNVGALRRADGVEIPNVPYLIRDVENGAAMRNISPADCVEQLRKQGRLGLVTEEGIAIVTHKPETLNDHYIDLLGSVYASGVVPCLSLNAGRPELDWHEDDIAHSWSGSASCGSRIIRA